MPWTETTRKHDERQSAQYSRDMTDGKWAIIAPLLPDRTRLGRRCNFELGKVEVRDVWDAIQYSVASGCAWSLLPKDFPPVSTMQYYFYRWRDALIDIGRRTIRIVKRSDTAQGFEVLPRRWVAERTFAWLGKCRRVAKDWEKTIESAEAWVLIAHIRCITPRLVSA
jgi:transposase